MRSRKPSDHVQDKTNSFLVVGVGASAGGLEAFTQLLGALPPEPGIAFVLVQHLDPQHHSMLTDILSKTSKMPIHEARDGAAVQPDCIYVIPPDTSMAIRGGKLRLTPRLYSRHPHLPIDFFLRSLADDQKSNAIGVILSGTGSDGVAGLAAVKAEGGVTFAQDEKSAKFTGMPNSAIASGNVDFILPPKQIPGELLKLVRHSYRLRQGKTETLPFSSDNGGLNKVFALLRNLTGIDFTYYKPPTLQRRIHRRMAVQKMEKLDEYASFLQEHPAEVEKLYSDLLINVTSFFRDPQAYEALEKEVFPRIVKGRTPNTPIRIWAPGCSSGEEAYSLAIVTLEYLGQIGMNIPLQVFGTEISEASLEKARKGLYPESISVDVTPERLRRFFVRVDGEYVISKSVRDTCVFSRHNLVSDPPFSNMDLVCCRNVLIYMGPLLQKKIVPMLHYALKPNGFLFLGSSESVSGFEDIFAPLDKKHRIFLQKPTPVRRHLDVARYRLGTGIVQDGGRFSPGAGEKGLDVQKEADRIILANHAPSGVIINGDMEVLQFRGRTSPFLEPPSGKASFNLLRMARQGLAAALQIAIKKAKKTNAVVKKQSIHLQLNGSPGLVRIEVAPLPVASGENRCFLVLFEENIPAKAEPPPKSANRGAKSRLAENREISRLKRELADVQDAMGVLVEAHEASAEELRSVNEEVLSANEELQSTNEELETSKEELQSANEELHTLNDELRSRNHELGQSNSDLMNVMSSANLPLVVVGSDLRIRRFTPTADRAFHIIASDIGRPITHLRSRINAQDLEQLILQVIGSLTPQEREVEDSEGHWHLLQIRPYRTLDNKIDGAVLSLVDIDAQKQVSEQQRKAKEFAEAIVDTVREPLLLLDSDLRILKVNASFYEIFRVTPQETEHRFLYRIGNEQWNIPKLRVLLENSLANSRGEVRDFEVEHEFPGIGHKIMLVNARRISESSPSREPLILLAIEDITARKQGQAALRASEERFRTLFQLGPVAVYYCNASGVILEFNYRAVQLWGRAPQPGDTEERFCGSHKLFRPDGTFMPHELCPMAEVLSGKIPEARNIEVHIERRDGSRIIVIVNIRPLKNERGEITGAINCFSDITSHRRADLALRTTERLATVGRMAATLAHEINNPLESVTNFIYLAGREQGLPDLVRKYLQAADEELVRIAHMTKQTLGLYRESTTPEPVDVSDLWKNLLSMFSAKTKNRRIHVNLELATEARILGLAGELRQVFANLLSNSIDAVNLDGTIRIRVADAHKNGSRRIPGVRTTIADNGAGIASDNLERIFEPFFTTKENVGTGLGLWVSKEILENHKGSIRIRSSTAPGRAGTVASVFLPLNPLQ